MNYSGKSQGQPGAVFLLRVLSIALFPFLSVVICLFRFFLFLLSLPIAFVVYVKQRLLLPVSSFTGTYLCLSQSIYECRHVCTVSLSL